MKRAFLATLLFIGCASTPATQGVVRGFADMLRSVCAIAPAVIDRAMSTYDAGTDASSDAP